MIDVKCVNSVSNRSKDIISFIIKVCRCFCSTSKYSTFMMYLHLQDQLISNSYGSTYYNKLLYVCVGGGGEGYCELLLIFQISYLQYMQFCYSIYIHGGMRERERHPVAGMHLGLNHDQAHKLVV